MFKNDKMTQVNPSEVCENTNEQWNEVMKAVRDMKTEAESLKKISTETKLEMKILESHTQASEVSPTKTRKRETQAMKKRWEKWILKSNKMLNLKIFRYKTSRKCGRYENTKIYK